MGKRSTPPLTPAEVVAILKSWDFIKKGQEGSHAQWERTADGKRPRSVVTVDMHYKDFDADLMRNMIRQSNLTRDEFYGATKRTARKASVPFLRLSPSSETE